MKTVKNLDDCRYIGDRTTTIVHDSWNRDSEHCLLDELVDRGDAVGFDPDTLEQSFWEGFDYCDHCFGKRDPTSPYRGKSRGRARSGKSKASLGMSLSG